MAYPFWEMSYATGDEKKEKVEELPVQKIRLTVTSSKLRNLQSVCNNLIQRLKKGKIDVRGPIPMPRKRLRVTTRRAPCGNGTETYDHFELRVHKRVIDFKGTAESVKEVTKVALEPDVQVEVTVISQ